MGTIKSFKKFIEESIWSDIQDRSTGETERKEDDVNLLDLNEFYKYIKEQYKTKVEYIDLDSMGGGNGDVLGVDITEDIILFYKPKRGHILLSWSRVKIPMPFFDELADRFKIENPNAMRRIITEKDGSCTNKTFVDAIEFFLGHKESMMNESIWSDIQDRSSGEITRKEDSVNLMDKDEFFEYIKSHYKVIIDCEAPGCGTGYIRFPLFVYPRTVRYILWDPFDKRIMVRTPYIEVWPDDLLSIIDREYKREDIIDRNRDHMTYIYPKEGDGGNQFFLDFIDNMLANVDKPALKKKVLNESIWSDIQDRSSSEVVRKEDEYDIDENELERGVEGSVRRYVIQSIYSDYYDGSSDTFLKCIQEWDKNICTNAQLYDRKSGKHINPSDVLPLYINKNWETGKSYKSFVEKAISKEEKKVKDSGFVKKPGESISDTLSKWFSENTDILEQDYSEEIEEHNAEYHSEGGSRYTDLGVEEWWDDLKYIKQIEIYQEYMKKTNESIWSDIQDRSGGETIRKEDEMTKEDFDAIDDFMCEFATRIVWDNWKCSRESFCKCIKDYVYDMHEDADINRILKYVDSHWSELNDRLDGYIKQEEMEKEDGMNESIWSDIQDRSAGETVRKEDELTEKDRKDLDALIVSYANEVVYGRGMGAETCYLDNFCDYIETDNEIKDLNKDKILQYVKDYWADEVCDSVDGAIEQAQSEYHQDMYESIWSDIQDRSSGDTVRKEDEMNGDDYNALKTTLKMFGREVRFFGNPKNHPYAPVGSEKYKHTLKDCLKYIDILNDNGFTNVDFPKLKRYIEANWEKDPMIQKIIQWTVDGKNSKEIDHEIRNAAKNDEIWDLNECDGVPGGITPADVGGMGPAYFPGPNGEPGSGDLPSPTGVVYHQVAPYTMFLKGQKKKKKKKKFRIEDEPCAHSKNSKVYNYVDDFREYVDRTYNNIDRRK